jgi:hypothetical protein
MNPSIHQSTSKINLRLHNFKIWTTMFNPRHQRLMTGSKDLWYVIANLAESNILISEERKQRRQ